jgi:hypothetical protein
MQNPGGDTGVFFVDAGSHLGNAERCFSDAIADHARNAIVERLEQAF